MVEADIKEESIVIAQLAIENNLFKQKKLYPNVRALPVRER